MLLKEIEAGVDTWDVYLSTSKAASIFHQADWLTIIQTNQNLELIKLGLYDNGVLIGLLPLYVKNIGIMRIASSPFYVEDSPYMGFVFDENVDVNDVIGSVFSYMKLNRINFVRFVQQQYYANVRSNKFVKTIEKHTHVLKLDKSVDELWRNLEGRCRTAVRKAEKCGIKVSFVFDVQVVHLYYQMLTEVYGCQQLIYPHPRDFFIDIFNKFNGSQLYMLVARLDEEIIAGGIFLVDKETVYYLNGASRREYNNTGVNNLIQWKSIQHAHELGKLYYDFVGSDMARFGKFKKSFGGDVQRNQCIEITDSHLTAIIRRWYPVIKRVTMKYLKQRI
ncbi:MAG TPA: hypothetical protein DEP50_07955 [Acinetobacter lwoffii]|nr:hypothetical protein [Acinetobacter lwoffii]